MRGLQNAVEVYARDVDQSDYYDGFDVNTTVSEKYFFDGESLGYDFTGVALEWEEAHQEESLMRNHEVWKISV